MKIFRFPIAEQMKNKTLTTPTHPKMNKNDLDKIIDLVNNGLIYEIQRVKVIIGQM